MKSYCKKEMVADFDLFIDGMIVNREKEIKQLKSVKQSIVHIFSENNKSKERDEA